MDCTRPNRSDVHLSQEAAAKSAAATKDYFDGLAPKRHSKPQRSEYSSAYVDAFSSSGDQDDIVPEYVRFQHLEQDTQKLVYRGSNVEAEFVETEYYTDLNCVDKQHHTTGTGFIKIDNANGKGGFSLAPDSAAESHGSCKGNPATNDWIPATNDAVDFISGKPSRSG